MNDFLGSIKEIKQRLPHRDSFLLIDRVLEINCGPDGGRVGSKVVCLKNVTASDPVFSGHFPNNPIFPGVLSLEAMAQSGAFLLLKYGEQKKKTPVMLAVKNAKFRKAIVPGDQIIITATIDKVRLEASKFSAKCYVEDKVAAEAEFTATFV